MQLDLLTPEKKVFEGETDSFTLPGAYGLFGVLNHHAPMLSTLVPGNISIKKGDDVVEFCISGGIFEFNSNKAVILADSAESPGEIDLPRVHQAINRAKKRLKDRKNVDVLRAELALQRALARQKAHTGK